MATCKTCQWWNKNRDQWPDPLCCLNPKFVKRNAIDPACSHYKSLENSPGILNFVHRYGQDGHDFIIIGNDQYKQETFRNLEIILPKIGQMKTFRLEPVEE